MKKPETIDQYLASFPEEAQVKMEALRNIIRQEAPDATEAIGYSMPGFKGNKFLVYFAGWKSHIGFYPSGSGIQAFEHELAPFEHSKGAIQFPMNEPLPEDLIRRIVRYRVEQDKAAAKPRKPRA